MIPAPEAVQFVLQALSELDIDYFVTGSLVSNAYGEPRGTLDADFVILATEEAFEKLALRLAEQFEREPQLSFETVTAKTKHEFRHRGSKFLIEFFDCGDDPHDMSRFERRLKREMLGQPAYFPTAEDCVVTKLRWFKRAARPKDWDDVVKVIRRQQATLDWDYVEKWCSEHGSLELLTEARNAAAELG